MPFSQNGDSGIAISAGVPQGCIKDDGKSLGAGLQEQASNTLKLHWLRAGGQR
jgi:hypothetical protein